MVNCPFHEDTEATLEVEMGKGTGVFRCKETSCEAHNGGDAANWLQLKGIPRLEAIKLAGKTRGRGEAAFVPKARKKLKVWSPLPKGEATHEYFDAANNKICVVIRRPEFKPDTLCMPFHKVKGGWQAGKPNTGLMPLYNLHKLEKVKHDQYILIVEGEGDCDLWNKNYGAHLPALTSFGGPGQVDKTDWRPLEGRKVAIVSDADDDGREYASDVALKLYALGSTVLLWLRQGDDGSDLSNLIADFGHKATAEKIKSNMFTYQPEEQEDDQPRRLENIQQRDLYTNNFYKMLGRIKDGILFRDKRTKQLVEIPMASITKGHLFKLAPLWWWCEQGGVETEKHHLGSQVMDALVSGIIEISKDLPLIRVSEIIEQGAHKDPRAGVVWHLGDRVLRPDGSDYELDSDEMGHYYAETYKIEWKPPTESWRDHALALANAVMGYRWRNELDARLMVGFMGCCFSAGALDWRPNIWLSAGHGTGKSWFSDRVLKPFFGDIQHYVTGNTTVPYLARVIGNSSVPVIIDEFTGSGEVLDFIRTNTSGSGVRGRASNKDATSVTQTRPRCSYFISSVEMPELRPEDASRYALIKLNVKGFTNDKWKLVADAINEATMPNKVTDVRNGLIQNADQLVDLARKQRAKIDIMNYATRAAELYSALFAGMELMGVAPQEEDYKNIASGTANLSSDIQALKALQALMASPMRLEFTDKIVSDFGPARWTTTPMSFSLTEIASSIVNQELPDGTRLKEDSKLYHFLVRTLKKVGMVWSKTNDAILIHTGHPMLQQLVKKAGLGNVDVGELFQQIPGAIIVKNKPKRFGDKVVSRYISLNLDAIPLLEIKDD